MNQSTNAAALRAWSTSSYSAAVPAAVELLIRANGGRLCAPDRPWVEHDENGRCWIDFERIEQHTWALDPSDRQILLIAASLAGDQPIVLGRVLIGVDQEALAHVLDAVAVAGSGKGGNAVRRTEPATSGLQATLP